MQQCSPIFVKAPNLITDCPFSFSTDVSERPCLKKCFNLEPSQNWHCSNFVLWVFVIIQTYGFYISTCHRITIAQLIVSLLWMILTLNEIFTSRTSLYSILKYGTIFMLLLFFSLVFFFLYFNQEQVLIFTAKGKAPWWNKCVNTSKCTRVKTPGWVGS